MKTITGFVCVLIGLAGLVSCQKEVSFTDPDNNVLGDSIYLSKLVEIDTTQPVGLDTLAKTLFYYDNTKRLVKLVIFYPGSIDTVREEFFYQGADPLPYKQVYHDIYDAGGSPAHYVDTIYYTYSNGLVVKDSVIEWNLITSTNYGASVKIFTNLGTKVLEQHRDYDWMGGSYVLNSDMTKAIFVNTAGGNILSHTDTSSWQTYIASAQVSYDNKVNPYYQALKIHYPDFQFLDGAGWNLQKNNPLVIDYENAGGGMEHETVTYQYRSDGYPLVGRMADVADNFFTKSLYYYIP